MGTVRTTGIVKEHNEADIIVGAWISQEKMDKIGAKIGNFLFVERGWSGSLSCRAVIKGTLPAGFDGEDIALTEDRITEGNFKSGDSVRYWKHTSWF